MQAELELHVKSRPAPWEASSSAQMNLKAVARAQSFTLENESYSGGRLERCEVCVGSLVCVSSALNRSANASASRYDLCRCHEMSFLQTWLKPVRLVRVKLLWALGHLWK